MDCPRYRFRFITGIIIQFNRFKSMTNLSGSSHGAFPSDNDYTPVQALLSSLLLNNCLNIVSVHFAVIATKGCTIQQNFLPWHVQNINFFHGLRPSFSSNWTCAISSVKWLLGSWCLGRLSERSKCAAWRSRSFDGLVQNCNNSSALAMESLLSRTQPWMQWLFLINDV